MNAMLGCAVLLTLGLPLTAQAATTVAKGTDPTKQVLRGPIVLRDSSVLQGEVVIEGDAIICVAADCPDPPGASVFTVSDAFIFPGFIGQQQESCVGDVEASIRPTFTVSFGRSSCKQLSVYVLRSPC